MRLHLVQHRLENLRYEENRARAAALIGAAGVAPGALIVLPEMFSLGILPAGFDAAVAEVVEREDRVFLSEQARAARSHLLGSTASLEGGTLSNLSLLFDPEGRVVGGYRKLHPFTLGGEEKHITGGGEVVTLPLERFTLQPTICYDLRFPELYRAGMRAGADLMTVQANWPESRREHWDVLLRARAIENQSFVAGVNCVGAQSGTAYFGGSRIVSPKGEVIAQGGEGEEVVSAEITAEHVRAWRRAFPALRDRKPDGFWNA
jgi:predicted amidohydrolase